MATFEDFVGFNLFTATYNSVVDSLRPQMAAIRSSGSNTLIDQSMNVILTGISENRDASVWQDIVTRALNHAAGTQVDVTDAFRIGRYSNGK
jgi:hypothetical protein